MKCLSRIMWLRLHCQPVKLLEPLTCEALWEMEETLTIWGTQWMCILNIGMVTSRILASDIKGNGKVPLNWGEAQRELSKSSFRVWVQVLVGCTRDVHHSPPILPEIFTALRLFPYRGCCCLRKLSPSSSQQKSSTLKNCTPASLSLFLRVFFKGFALDCFFLGG